jgi:hypothetical protein
MTAKILGGGMGMALVGTQVELVSNAFQGRPSTS